MLDFYIHSGGHLNPAVTLGVFIAGGINIIAAILYWLAQIMGSITGTVCVLVGYQRHDCKLYN